MPQPTKERLHIPSNNNPCAVGAVKAFTSASTLPPFLPSLKTRRSRMGTVAGALGVYINKQDPVVGTVDRLLRLTLLWMSSVMPSPSCILEFLSRKAGYMFAR
jgi:hypothetical protein